MDFCAKYERNACLGLDLLSDMKNLFHRIKSNQGFNRLNGALALLVLTIFTNPPSSAWAQTAPVITNKPAATIVLAGSGVNFAVGVSGTGPFTYQWYSNGNPLQSSAVEPTNVISTVAGGGVGDFGYATNAALYAPSGVAMDGAGNLYIADRDNERIRKVDTNGVITTVAGNGTNGYAGDGGAATNAELANPIGVAADGTGNLYIADFINNRIRKVDTNGVITTVAGNGVKGYAGDGGTATNAELANPTGIAADGTGNLYITDSINSRIRKVDTNGLITTVAGNGVIGYAGDGGAATNAELGLPSSVAVDGTGNLYIADEFTFSIRKVDTNGVITTVAGNGAFGYAGDGGEATHAELNSPTSVAMDGAGNLYIADMHNQRIRKVDANGVITTVAGNGTNGYAGDGGAATNSELNLPHSVAVDGVGNLYIADAGNMRIRKVSVAGSAVLSLADTVLTDSGNYWVIINSPFGSVTSSLFPVTVVMRPVSNQVVLGGDGTLVLDAVTTTNVSSRVWAAASLVPPILWHPVYTNALGGAWRFTDTNAALNISRFYRVSTP